MKIGSPAFRRKILELVPSQIVQEYIGTVDRLDNYSRSIYEESKKALEKGDEGLLERVGQGKDILSILREQHHSHWLWSPLS